MTHARLVVALAVLLLAIPQAAIARESGPTWESETQGSPVSTLQGHWTESDDGRSVELVFLGGHLVQAGTTFTATWLSPFTTAGERPRYRHSYEMENFNELGEDIELIESFRFRSKGDKWFPWMTFRTRLKPGFNFMGGGGDFRGGSKRPVQFEWKLTGTIEAPSYLRGSATFSIN